MVFIPPLFIGAAAAACATVGIILTTLAAACVVFIPLVIGDASATVAITVITGAASVGASVVSMSMGGQDLSKINIGSA